ncbi:MAG: hypothetical protein PHH11_16550 [Methylomonas sp.]|nr:hypothetical protein [Methylomonas sp.]
MDRFKKHLDLIVVVVIVLALVFYDLTFDLLAGLLHFLLERGLELFEWFELGIEHAVEHLFHTSHHGAQIVTFYILCLLAGIVFYRFWLALPRFYDKLTQTVRETWLRRKAEWELYWLSLTLGYKVILIGTALAVAYLASFFVM